jgi:uncharacterized membrane protein
MWFIGMIAGLFIGALTESVPAALILAVVGAFALPKIVGKKNTAEPERTDAERVQPSGSAAPPGAGGATAPAGGMLKLQQRVAELEQRVSMLERRLAQGAGEIAPADEQSVSTASASPALVIHPAIQGAPAAPTTPAAAPAPIPRPAQASAAAAAAAAARASVPAAPPLEPAQPAPAPAAAKPPVAVPAPRRLPPPPPPAIPLRDRLPAPVANLIFGGNMLVKLGVLILFLGLAFLLRYTAERVTVPIELRYAAVALVGAGLLALGWFLRRKRTGYALILQGAGIGVFYLTTLAAMKVHDLLPPTAGFAFLFGVAVLSAVLAVLQNAPMLAIVAALEGFAAPVLASTGQNRPVGLFTYLLVLDAGIVLIAWFKAWRVLNLIGFVGTFTLAAGWAHKYYTDDQYGIVQPFLLVFFGLFVAVGLLFARRTLFDAPVQPAQPLATRALDTLRRAGRVDSSLVFGTPMVAFGMQYLLMQPWEYGAAFSAMALSAFYLVLGRLVFATQPKGLALLAEAYGIVGVIFGTLAIPLGLEGQWTGAAWAVEAAGMYWLGARQERVYARAFSFVVFAGAVWKLLEATQLVAAPDQPLLQGSVIGPLLVAVSAFAMWAIHRRARLDDGNGWEALVGTALPWLGMGALTLLLWQWFTPPWAAAATAVLASVAFAVAMRFKLRPLAFVTYGMQALAVAGFIATLHRAAEVGGNGEQVLASGWQGAVAASLIALSLLGSAAWSMLQAHRAALARGIQPEWSLGNAVAVVAGVSLLHLAMLFQLSLAQAALLWPLTATAVLWVALRIAHKPLAALAGVLQMISALLHVFSQIWIFHGDTPPAAFAHLGFWTPVVLGLAALLAGAWMSDEAGRRLAAGAPGAKRTRWINEWCANPAVLWAPVIWGLGWWLFGWLDETADVLRGAGLGAYMAAAATAIVLVTSALSAVAAHRRDWRQLARSRADRCLWRRAGRAAGLRAFERARLGGVAAGAAVVPAAAACTEALGCSFGIGAVPRCGVLVLLAPGCARVPVAARPHRRGVVELAAARLGDRARGCLVAAALARAAAALAIGRVQGGVSRICGNAGGGLPARVGVGHQRHEPGQCSAAAVCAPAESAGAGAVAGAAFAGALVACVARRVVRPRAADGGQGRARRHRAGAVDWGGASQLPSLCRCRMALRCALCIVAHASGAFDHLGHLRRGRNGARALSRRAHAVGWRRRAAWRCGTETVLRRAGGQGRFVPHRVVHRRGRIAAARRLFCPGAAEEKRIGERCIGRRRCSMKPLMKSGRSATRIGVALALAMAGFNAAAAQPAVTAPITLQGSGPYYRLTLPLGIYAHAAYGDLRDVRVRNSAGSAVPYAWLRNEAAAPRLDSREVPIFALPAGAAGAADASDDATLSFRVRPDGSLALARKPARRQAEAEQWLIDASQLKGSLLQARFEMAPEARGLFAFRLEASDDLRRWRPVGGEEQLVRLAHGGQAIEQLAIDLENVQARFLRLRWADPKNGAPLTRVAIDSVQEIEPVAPLEWSAALRPERCGADHCDYALPRGAPVESLRIDLADVNTLAQVGVSGLLSAVPVMAPEPARVPRNPLYALRHSQRRPASPAAGTPGEVPLLDTVVYRLAQAGGEARSPLLALDGASYSYLRLRTSGPVSLLGATPPTISVGATPRTLVFLAQGAAPFSLAWNTAPEKNTVQGGAPGAALSLATLVPGYDPGKPVLADPASVALPPPPVAVVDAVVAAAAQLPVPAQPDPSRKWWLWGALGVGLLLLAAMAWSLFASLRKDRAATS